MLKILSPLLSGLVIASAVVAQPRPGNLFLKGEEVSVALPAGTDPHWSAKDYDGQVIAQGTAQGGRADLGKLPVGYYEIRRAGSNVKTTAGVLNPRIGEIPADSAVSMDVAMAWFYKDRATQEKIIQILHLAGVNWVRDRLSWPDMEKSPGQFVAHNIYDETADLQSGAGFKILQVNHIAPPWSTDKANRFPLDLRDAYRFYKTMAARWKGKVLAIEPWNEPDIDPFGKQTGAEIAAMQKASYLGLKAGNPETIACMAVLAHDDPSVMSEFAANEPWAYFDTYNFHTYPGIKDYPRIYSHHREISGGKPLWVTECNVPVHFADPVTREPDDTTLRIAALRVGRIYSTALYEGASNVFYFILNNYVERQIQYGLLHSDLTPRPAFLAYANVSRFLAGAKPLGRLQDPQIQGYAFSTKVDDKETAMAVTWAKAGVKDAKIPFAIKQATDCIGRPMTNPLVNESPVFITIGMDVAKSLKLQTPPARAAAKTGAVCDIVLQPLGADKIAAYNFGTTPAHGTLNDQPLDLAPGERKELSITASKIEGNFPGHGRTVLTWHALPAHAQN